MSLLARIAALERLAEVAEPAGISWQELAAAERRVGARVVAKLCAHMGRQPDWQTLAELEGDSPAQAALDKALLREWDRQHGVERDTDTLPKLLERLDRLAATRREPWH